MNLKNHLFRFWNFWPPFLFSGIKINKISKDYRHVEVKLKLRFWNANFVGTQYGGLMFSMADPFYMVMLIQNLGADYVVWDKFASITYLKPGRTDLFATFSLLEEEIAAIHTTLKSQSSMSWFRKIEINDANGIVVAEVNKELYIRKKSQKS